MQPDTTTIWTPGEIRVALGKVLVESLGVDEGTVTDDASLVRDLGAELLLLRARTGSFLGDGHGEGRISEGFSEARQRYRSSFRLLHARSGCGLGNGGIPNCAERQIFVRAASLRLTVAENLKHQGRLHGFSAIDRIRVVAIRP